MRTGNSEKFGEGLMEENQMWLNEWHIEREREAQISV